MTFFLLPQITDKLKHHVMQSRSKEYMHDAVHTINYHALLSIIYCMC